jgi:hypothetical protein
MFLLVLLPGLRSCLCCLLHQERQPLLLLLLMPLLLTWLDNRQHCW